MLFVGCRDFDGKPYANHENFIYQCQAFQCYNGAPMPMNAEVTECKYVIMRCISLLVCYLSLDVSTYIKALFCLCLCPETSPTSLNRTGPNLEGIYVSPKEVMGRGVGGYGGSINYSDRTNKCTYNFNDAL